MITSFTPSLSKSAYLRLLEHQRKVKPHAYHPDYPLVFFITFSRVASGLSLIGLFFPTSTAWTGIALACMISATVASIAHLNVPMRFLTMVRNNKSHLVWEIRLAGAFTAVLGLQLLSLLGFLQGFQKIFVWVNFIFALLFLISTGLAYRFDTHPAWRSSVLSIYYIVTASFVGLAFQSVEAPAMTSHLTYLIILLSEVILLLLYRNQLLEASPFALKEIAMGRDRWIFLIFLLTSLLLPGFLSILLLLLKNDGGLTIALATSVLIGIFFERILFFRVERPVFFLSFVEKPNGKGHYWVRG